MTESGFIDIEDALQEMLRLDGFSASAKPLPSGFASSLPHVCVDRVSAWADNAAQAVYSVDLDVRAADYASAAAAQAAAANWARGLAGREVGGAPCYRVESLGMGRARPDPSNKGVVLATVTVGLRLRIRAAV